MKRRTDAVTKRNERRKAPAVEAQAQPSVEKIIGQNPVISRSVQRRLVAQGVLPTRIKEAVEAARKYRTVRSGPLVDPILPESDEDDDSVETP